jgi:hypothetical protein|tara:strand:+ start:756 stop:974 length:219 start_codon:yes stop_codon:yes gene_type:complete
MIQEPKQLNLPFIGGEAHIDKEPLPQGVQNRIKRVEIDYEKLTDGRVSVKEAEFTYLKDGRIITKYSTEFLD